MICIDDCRNCRHKRPLLDGWRSCCDAFPDGKPAGFDYSNVKEAEECNNGIGYDEIDNPS